MSIFPRCSGRLAVVVALCAIACTSAFATQPVHPVANPCQRFAAGSVVNQSPALFSQNGVLNVRFSYQQTTDAQGRLLHCLMTDTGLEEPTLHVNPGDTLNITVTNNTPPQALGEMFNAPNCGDNTVEFTPPANGIRRRAVETTSRRRSSTRAARSSTASRSRQTSLRDCIGTTRTSTDWRSATCSVALRERW